MKNLKLGNQGMTGIEIAVIGAIVLVSIVISLLMIVVFLKIHVSRVVEIEYNYNNAELAMLALLSDEHIYEQISLYVAGLPDNPPEGFTRSGVETMVESKLENLVPSGCFKLSFDSGTIVDKNCDPVYGVTADISLPYGRNEEQIRLEIK
jgi:hypothetical protein